MSSTDRTDAKPEPARNGLLRLADRLFDAGECAERSQGGTWLVRYLALAGVLALVIFLRRPDSILNPQFWAEDGTVYFYDQVTLGFWSALTKLWNDFPYLVQRLVAVLAAVVPLVAVPLAYNASAIAITALTMPTFSLPGFRHLVRSDALRAAVCVAIVCIPAGQELLATPTNLGWFLAPWLVFLSVMRAPRSPALVVAWCLGGGLAVFSTPLAPVAAPLWVLRCVYGVRRHRRSDLAFALTQFLALLALAGMGRLLGAGEAVRSCASVSVIWRADHLWSALWTVPYVSGSCIDTALLPMRAFERLEDLGTLAVMTPALVVTACVGLAFRQLSERGRTTVYLATYLFVFSIFLILAGRHILVRLLQDPKAVFPHLNPPPRTFTVLGHRYPALPYVALLLAAAGIIDGALRTRTQVVAVAVACAGLLAWAPDFHVLPFTDLKWPLWAARLEGKFVSGTREALVIPVYPPPFKIAFDSPTADGARADDPECAPAQ